MAIEVRGVCTLILVFDMPTALRFYRDVLGFELKATSDSAAGDNADWCYLTLGKAELMLNGMHEARARPPAPDAGRNAAHEDTCLYFACPDVDAAYRHLQAKGIEVQQPTIAQYGMKQLHVRDPDGYNLCFQWKRLEDDDMHCARSFVAAGLAAAALGLVMPASGQGERPRVERFTIAIPDAVLTDLDERLARTRWPDQVAGTGWDYGTDTAYLRELVDYWQREYDWREQERALNQFEHYRATVDGTRIHFVHAKSRDPNAIPLLLLHGWPSTFVQMLDLIPLLTDPAAHGMPNAPSFHVVAASLPGFGFSDVTARTGVGFATSAELIAKVMHDALGYERYGVRGSDLGGVIVRQMALLHPEHVIGVHLTGIIGAAGATPPLTAAEQKFVEAVARVEPELAYARLQTSKPQTLAVSLNDSPVGLAAWVVEKFRAWGDTNGNVESRFSKDDLITNLMVYWVTSTAPSSVRMYYDFVREPLKAGRVERPVGMLMSTKDLFPAAPREFGERLLNVQHWVETDKGGHFLEWEEPELVARDLQTFFGGLPR